MRPRNPWLEDNKYKLYLVEVDDEDRERVLRALVLASDIIMESDYGDVSIMDDNYRSDGFAFGQIVTLRIKAIPDEHGHLFTIENFKEEDERDDEG